MPYPSQRSHLEMSARATHFWLERGIRKHGAEGLESLVFSDPERDCLVSAQEHRVLHKEYACRAVPGSA